MQDKKTLLVEIGTEELPPTSLKQLAEAFSAEVDSGLGRHALAREDISWFASPRRLALRIDGLSVKQASKQHQRRGPALTAAYDEDGQATQAALGFARSCAVAVEQLETLETDKGNWLVYKHVAEGQDTTELIPDIIRTALHRLPIARRMRWGMGQIEFIRPVHWLLILFGKTVIECELLGQQAGRLTYGHRFHAPHAIPLDSAETYPERLQQKGQVNPDFQTRLSHIQSEANRIARQKKGTALIDRSLLEEVTALTEWPVLLLGEFDKAFLTLPKEVLIATMQKHQKYFPIMTGDRLLPFFISVSNIASTKPALIIRGNERVIHTRLTDARFFYTCDCTRSLEDRIDGLKRVIYQQQLGTVYDKSRRVRVLASELCDALSTDSRHAMRAAELGKCDLLTEMVNEFPALQGIMGRYYALHNNEAREVAIAIDEQYMPRFSGAPLPQTETGQVLAIAEKIDTLVGHFVSGQIPSGNKDVFGLRRLSLGILRIMIECELDLDLLHLIRTSVGLFEKVVDPDPITAKLFMFIMERLRHYYLDKGINTNCFEAVLVLKPSSPLDFHHRLQAVSFFQTLAEADKLSMANKRINNILKQSDLDQDNEMDSALLQEPAEKQLAKEVTEHYAHIASRSEALDYKRVLMALAGLKDSVDHFFDHVMVMSDDRALRTNRLALLRKLRDLFLKVADISKLSG